MIATTVLVVAMAIKGVTSTYLSRLATRCESPCWDPAGYPNGSVIHRDVAVIGGGASGTYVAVRLQDNNQSVVILEKKLRLGGHAESFVDSETGVVFDIGTQIFHNVPVVREFFARFNVSLKNSLGFGPTTYINFAAAGEQPPYVPPNIDDIGDALSRYATLRANYPGLDAGFNLTYPVDPELLLPFGYFLKSHDLGAMVEPMTTVMEGFVPLLGIPTLYGLKAVTPSLVRAFQTNFVLASSNATTDLYDRIAESFGSDDALYNITIQGMDRSSNGTKIVVDTSTGPKLIIAKKLVSAIQPTLNATQGYDLSDQENDLFKEFYGNGYYVVVLTDTGLTGRFENRDSNRLFGVPDSPLSYQIEPVRQAPEYTRMRYGSEVLMSEEEVKQNALGDLERVRKAYGNESAQGTEPRILGYSSHSPYNLMVSNEVIENMFYEKLYALQGQRSTWYTGAAWMTQDSSVLWQWTEDFLLPRILGAAR